MENEKANNTKEKMLKSCKKLKNVITGFQWLIVGSIIVSIIIMLIFSISTMIQPNDDRKDEAGNNLVKVIDAINNFEENLDLIRENKTANLITEIVVVVANLLTLDYLIKILKSTIENKTPFTANNIKYLKKIDIFAFIIWVATTPFILNVGIIYVLVISIITYIFEYGYQLQLESDETL